MNIVFRVDTRYLSGGGHFYRCLNLAKGLKNKNTYFIIDKTSLYFKKILTLNKFKYFELKKNKSNLLYEKHDSQKTLEILKNNKKFDLIIVDNYSLGKKWEILIKNLVKKTLVIDDLNRSHECNFFLNQNLPIYKKKIYRIPSNCKKLLGPKYCILNPIYKKFKKKIKKKNKINNIILFMGVTDSAKLTFKILNAFLHKDLLKYNLKIVVGNNNKDFSKIKKLSKKRKKTKVHYKLDNLAKLIQNSDLGISSGGSVVWEYLYFSLPNLILSYSKKQSPNSIFLEKKKYSQIIGNKNIHLNKLTENIKKKILILEKIKLNNNKKSLVDGRGTARIKKTILMK